MIFEKLHRLKHGFLGQSFSIFLTRFFSTLAALGIVWYYSRMLSTDVYGKYQSFWTQVNFFNAIASLGIGQWLLSYKPAQVKWVLLLLIKKYSWLVLGALLLCGAIMTYTLSSLNVFFLWPFFLFCFYTLSITLEGALIALRRISVLPAINLLYAVAFIVWHVYVLNHGFDLARLIQGLTIIIAGKFLIYLFLLISTYRKADAAAQPNLSHQKIRRLWFHLYFFDATQLLVLLFDKFLLSHLLTSEEFAVYFNGTLAIPFLGLIFSAVSNATLLQLSEKQQRVQQAQILKNTSQLLACVAFPCFFFFYCFGGDLLHLYLTDTYKDSIPIFLMTLWIIPLRTFSFTAVLQNRHQGKIIQIGVWIEIITFLLLLYPLYKLMGLKGVPLAYVIGTYLHAAYWMYHIKRLLGVTFGYFLPWKDWVFKILTSLILLGLVRLYFYDENLSWMQLIAVGIFSGIIGLGLLYYTSKKIIPIKE